ncbi:hypothetical protein Y032_0606g578 [Ancylostoma ceylanicum]|uniref:Uncharacterized protein n=1 Tax=Ancylostoma ceylanicum TaxID=53326 RepID=A0A016WLA1_9BILA|nr:hypothetical protein Y032_0606g578 [Ancylostoma ceylanicum]
MEDVASLNSTSPKRISSWKWMKQYIDAFIAGKCGTAAYLKTSSSLAEPSTNTTHVSEKNPRLRIPYPSGEMRLPGDSTTLVSSSTLKDAAPTPQRLEQSMMPHLRDVSQPCTLLGPVNFNGSSVKNLHNFRAPLDALTKKDAVYTWTPECNLLSIAPRQRSNRIYS